MEDKKLFREIEDHIEMVAMRSTPLGISLWEALIKTHPADCAEFFDTIARGSAQRLFASFPHGMQLKVFVELSDTMKVFTLSFMTDLEKTDALHALPIDELTDLFDVFSDEELKLYLNLLHKQVRQKVLSLMEFEPDSAGGIMDIEVLSLMTDFTVERSIALLQRLCPSKDIYQQIYVTNKSHLLEGHINLEDLVLHKPHERISSFMHQNELVVRATDDQEEVAKKMVHYELVTVPVVDDNNIFLGVIPSETLIDVIVQEASEDVQKMAALPPMKYPYFQMSFTRLFYQRSSVLVALLVAESFSGAMLREYDVYINGLLMSFIPMLTSAGGNAGSQASAIAIQGLASGEFHFENVMRLLKRELLLTGSISVALGIISFFRVYWVGGNIIKSCIVSGTVSIIIFIASLSGTLTPFVLRRFHIDPAFFAGPFLATIMDILGMVIFCLLAKALFVG
ncbi:MAG: magnesium transporter [Candidatus Dependentiae bacterium]|nr:magnesium transporter [Candidatus Dependentiae bacterium]